MSRQVIHDSSQPPDETPGKNPRPALGAAPARRNPLIVALVYLWALPTTLPGLLLVLPTLATGGGARWMDGVLEIHGGLTSFILRRCTMLQGGASALTLGHVVLARDEETHDLTRSHERVHVRQVERWGPLFLPAYFIASIVARARGKHYYFDNMFEKEAYGSERG